jgi:hypothetical protein
VSNVDNCAVDTLGGILARRRLASSAENLQFNLAGQQANSLLHDGHAWKDFARTALAGTRRAMRSARTGGAPMLVHASFAFVHHLQLAEQACPQSSRPIPEENLHRVAVASATLHPINRVNVPATTG